jgi:hypothetical protein
MISLEAASLTIEATSLGLKDRLFPWHDFGLGGQKSVFDFPVVADHGHAGSDQVMP